MAAKFCPNCGGDLSELSAAAFCHRCGHNLQLDVSPVRHEPRWERCKIQKEMHAGLLSGWGRDYDFRYWADGIGPDGKYVVAVGPWIRGSNDRKHAKAIDDLVRLLTQNGWEPIGQGPEPWDYSFRRLITR